MTDDSSGTGARGPFAQWQDRSATDSLPNPPAEQESGASTRRVVLWIVGGAVVVVAGLGIAALTGAFDGPAPAAAPPAATVTLSSPVPTISPAPRTAVSAFADALPSSVLSYALTATVPYPADVAAGALEGYELTYSDGGTGTITVRAGQWADAPGAAAVYSASSAAATAAQGAAPSPAPTGPTSGTVQVDGKPAGQWIITTAADGTGTAWWTNGTAVFEAVGPRAVIAEFYHAFPL